MSSENLSEKVSAAKKASIVLAQMTRKEKDTALKAAAVELLLHKELILEANKKDLQKGAELLKEGKITKPVLDRLKLDAVKLLEISKMVENVANLEDPVGKTLLSTRMDDGLELFKITVPFGLIATIFESRPDALPQISSLAIKSGNAILMKGGSEAAESNRAIFKVMEKAFLASGLPRGCIVLVEGRSAVREILKLDGMVDLVIPRGGYDLVRYVQDNTRIPVLGHSSGLCHVYVDGSAEPEMAIEICHDSRVQYPAACNSMKVLLIDSKISKSLLPKIAKKLVDSGVVIKGCGKTVEILKERGIPVERASEADWSTEYLELILPTKIVSGVDEAIEHINHYSSKHTDSIISKDESNARKFLCMVDSSSVMWNASTRFSDGYRYGFGAEVGISTNKVHARGPVGLEGLVTTKFVLLGSGQSVSEYVGKCAKAFSHNKIEVNLEKRLAEWQK